MSERCWLRLHPPAGGVPTAEANKTTTETDTPTSPFFPTPAPVAEGSINCFVDPSNPYRVGLTRDETIGTPVKLTTLPHILLPRPSLPRTPPFTRAGGVGGKGG